MEQELNAHRTDTEIKRKQMFAGAITQDESVDVSISELQEAMKGMTESLKERDKFYCGKFHDQQEHLDRHRKDLDYTRTQWV